MNTPDTVIDTYLASWNEPDPEARSRLIEAAWTGDGRHVDPLADVTGHAALGELVAGLQAQFPDHRIRRVGSIDAHHDQLRFAWVLVAPDDTVVVAATATDVGELAPDGQAAAHQRLLQADATSRSARGRARPRRLQRISAFFGPMPDAVAA